MSKHQESLIQPIYESLLDRIMQGELTAGSRLSEKTLADEFHVSRTSIRTALSKLERDGLVELASHRTQIAQYTPQALWDIGTIRLALDNLAVKLSMLYGSQADFIELQKIAQTCELGMQTGNDKLRRSADCEFHLMLAKISRSKLLFDMQSSLHLRVNFILLSQQHVVKNKEIHVREHFDLLQAISQHNELQAQAIITNHLISFYGLNEKYPNGFFVK